MARDSLLEAPIVRIAARQPAGGAMAATVRRVCEVQY